MRNQLMTGDRLIFKQTPTENHRLKDINDPIYKILICDDDKDTCELISKSLKNIECVYSITHSLKGCLDKLKKDFFKIILLDNIFPEGNGLDMITHIKSVSPASKLIIMTGYGNDGDKLKALNYGAGYIEKPFNISQMLIKLNLVLNG